MANGIMCNGWNVHNQEVLSKETKRTVVEEIVMSLMDNNGPSRLTDEQKRIVRKIRSK